MTRSYKFRWPYSVVLLTLCMPGILPAQNPPGYRVIKVDNSSRHSPVRFSEIRCAGREVESGIPFPDPGDDWLDGCTIQLTNYIQKVVVAAQIQTFAPESGDGKTVPFAGVPIVAGRLPDWQMKDIKWKYANDRPPIALYYGESTVIACSEFATSLKSLVAEKGRPGSGISQVTLVLEVVDYSDGTQSQQGIDNFYKPNEAAGHGYIRIGRDDFYKGIAPPQ
jgi:hypothetical protein